MIIYNYLNKIQAFASFNMLGIILIIQFVHYPSFIFIDKSQFQSFEKNHSRKISFIVAPLMMAELLIALILSFDNPSLIQNSISIITILICLSTFLISVPIHKRLLAGYSKELIEILIKTNWIRTILWIIKSILVFKTSL